CLLPTAYSQISPLLQVLIRPLGLAEQERNVLVGGIDEPLHDLHGLLEFLDELVVLAVPPGLPEAGELAVEHRQLVEELVVELLQPRGEPADLLRIHDGLCHAMPLLSVMVAERTSNGRTPDVPATQGAGSEGARTGFDNFYVIRTERGCKATARTSKPSGLGV